MSRKMAERAHLTTTSISRKGNNHNKMFKFQRRNNQDNNQNPSSSSNGVNERFKRNGYVTFVKERTTTRQIA